MTTPELHTTFQDLLSKAPAAQAPPVADETTEVEQRPGSRKRGSRTRALRDRESRGHDRTPPATEEVPLGDYPIARLLPPEVVALGKVRATRAIVIYLVLGVLVLSGLAVAGSALYAQQVRHQLEAVQAQTGTVLAQETKYAPARTVDNEAKVAEAAQRVGAAGEIDWNAYFAKIQAVLPQGVAVTGLSGETATPTTAVTQDSAPLSVGRVADITMTISAPDQDAIADTLDRLQSLPGYAAAFPGAMTQGSASGAAQSWSAPITLSLNAGAFANRFGTDK